MEVTELGENDDGRKLSYSAQLLFASEKEVRDPSNNVDLYCLALGKCKKSNE